MHSLLKIRNPHGIRRARVFPFYSLKEASFLRSRMKKPVTLVTGFLFIVIAPGLEPGTVCLEGRCSIQLSYATWPLILMLLQSFRSSTLAGLLVQSFRLQSLAGLLAQSFQIANPLQGYLRNSSSCDVILWGGSLKSNQPFP